MILQNNKLQTLTPFGEWVKRNNWQLHSSKKYWYKLDHPDQWPTPHTADDDELYQIYLKTRTQKAAIFDGIKLREAYDLFCKKKPKLHSLQEQPAYEFLEFLLNLSDDITPKV